MEGEEKASIALEFATREDFFKSMSEAPLEAPPEAPPRAESDELKDEGRKLQARFVSKQSVPRSLTLSMPSSGVAKGRTSDPAVSDIGTGCYLIFNKEDDLFYVQWSDVSLPDSLGWCSPKAAVPKFKFKVNGGKQVLFKDFSKDRQAYYRAWCQFIKIGNEFDSKVMILDAVNDENLPPLKLFALETAVASKGAVEAESKVYELKTRNMLHDLKNVKSVVAVPDTSVSITEGSSMTGEFFEKVGSNDGGSTRLSLT